MFVQGNDASVSSDEIMEADHIRRFWLERNAYVDCRNSSLTVEQERLELDGAEGAGKESGASVRLRINCHCLAKRWGATSVFR